MWVLSSRSARRVTTAARASRSRRGPARRFCTNGNHGLVSDAIQTVRGRPTGPAELALVEAYALALASARGSSALLARARIAGSLLVRQEVHDKAEVSICQGEMIFAIAVDKPEDARAALSDQIVG